MPSVSTVAETLPCAFVKGSGIPQAERVLPFGIVGVSGVGVQLLGLFGNPYVFVAKQYGSILGLEAWYQTLHSFHGQITVVENDEGQLYPNQLVEMVSEPVRQTANNRKGSVEIWTVRLTTRTV